MRERISEWLLCASPAIVVGAMTILLHVVTT